MSFVCPKILEFQEWHLINNNTTSSTGFFTKITRLIGFDEDQEDNGTDNRHSHVDYNTNSMPNRELTSGRYLK